MIIRSAGGLARGACKDPARHQQRARTRLGRLLCARGLLSVGSWPAHGLASRKADCHFKSAFGHGGRAAVAGGQHARVCRRIRSPFLVKWCVAGEISCKPEALHKAPKH